MKKFLLTMVTCNALALPAMAADLTPVYKEQTVWTWTGFYFGGTVGGGWMSSNSTEAVTSTSCPFVAGICPYVGNAFAAAIPGSYNTTKAGFLGGVEVGYNWQLGRYVLGIETDLSGASISGSSAVTNLAPVAGAGIQGFSVADYGTHSEKLDYFGTVRGRAGFLVADPLLAYVTGGFAYGDASSSNSLSTTVVPLNVVIPVQSQIGESSSSKRAGWTIGGGLEWMFTPNFSVKGEYLYYDFGSVSYTGPSVLNIVPPNPVASGPFYGGTTSATADFKGSILRVGLNFKL